MKTLMTHEIKIRKDWGGFNPIQRVHGQGKGGHKPKYSKRDRNDWKRGGE